MHTSLSLYTYTFCGCYYVHVADLRREVSELRLAHADTAAELEKTRQLLSAQRAINQDYHREVHVPYILHMCMYTYVYNYTHVHAA